MHSQILSQILAPQPASGGGGTVAFVAGGEGFCGSCTTTSFSLPATTGTNHILYVGDNEGGTGGGISSITGGGTWVAPAGCAISDVAVGFGVSCAYALSSSSGTSSITLNFNGSAQQHVFFYYEYSCSATASVDTSGAFDESSNTSPMVGIALTLSGTNDIIYQNIRSAFSAPTGISSPYGEFNNDTGAQSAWATAENTTNGSAPTWTNGTAQKWEAGALAIKCQ